MRNSLVLLEETQALHGAKAPCRLPSALFEGALQHIRHVASYQACALNSFLALAGAGADIARKFAREGFKVALVSRKQETLAPIAQEITESGGQALSVPADTGKPPARQHLFANNTLHEK